MFFCSLYAGCTISVVRDGRMQKVCFSMAESFSAPRSFEVKVEICSISLELLIFVLPGLPSVPALLSSACFAGMGMMTIVAATARRIDRASALAECEKPRCWTISAGGASFLGAAYRS